ncbi:hypothetical protein FQZ97_940990 [compost metagenome]
MGVDEVLVGAGLEHASLVVELEQRKLAALAVDHAEVGHDAGQDLWVAAFHHVTQRRARKAAHLAFNFVEQMAREVETDRGFLHRQAFLHAPGHGRHQVGVLRAGAVVAVAEDVGLRGVGGRSGCEGERAVHRGKQLGAVEVQ